MTSPLDRFPSFAVEALDEERGQGRFDRPPSYPAGWVYLHLEAASFAEIYFERIQGSEGPSVFRVGEGDAHRLRVGRSYRWLDAYWGPMAQVALDRERGWEHVPFAPRAAARVIEEHRTWLRPAEPDETGDIVEGAWDHEHCELCRATISLHEQRVGWRSRYEEWVCEACYETFVRMGSLDFIPGPD